MNKYIMSKLVKLNNLGDQKLYNLGQRLKEREFD